MLISVWRHMHVRATYLWTQSGRPAPSATPASGIWGSTLTPAADSSFSPLNPKRFRMIDALNTCRLTVDIRHHLTPPLNQSPMCLCWFQLHLFPFWLLPKSTTTGLNARSSAISFNLPVATKLRSPRHLNSVVNQLFLNIEKHRDSEEGRFNEVVIDLLKWFYSLIQTTPPCH